MEILKNKKIILGVTGSVAVYKACSLIGAFQKLGAEVRVVMTDAATKFVQPLTFQSLTHSPVFLDMWDENVEGKIGHIELSHWADLIVIAPASANTIGKIANGLADNLLTLIVSASYPKPPVVVVPAMNTNMLDNPITQKNIKFLEGFDKYKILGTKEGLLACQDVGKGKMIDTAEIIKSVEEILK
ncbi:MAG: hypothetical protein A2556_00500 [Candidatus Vogelbacteria bacterium RIFOXYD2_FULL_44_9]|uniref:Flavoprotein domain-containing protein n=1 Tax=Candidatus Vogelbacteria bacterium RIFOXYD2_FULL_44_9 TaxID=1802441 RepID=A0A1G2QK86_9BACT|nr:MAG: hypothetical protein A2556_00500 [Candidatus Vogelbacteria bacterium RIFOXYD2_FULL_44_9]